MAIVKPNVADWENIFLDTSVVINLLLSQKTGVTDPETHFIYKLVSFLANNKRKDGKKDRTFFISSITLSEILSDEKEGERIQQILKVVGSSDVEFISFDETIALDISRSIAEHLTNKNLNRFAQEIGWKTHELIT